MCFPRACISKGLSMISAALCCFLKLKYKFCGCPHYAATWVAKKSKVMYQFSRLCNHWCQLPRTEIPACWDCEEYASRSLRYWTLSNFPDFCCTESSYITDPKSGMCISPQIYYRALTRRPKIQRRWRCEAANIFPYSKNHNVATELSLSWWRSVSRRLQMNVFDTV